MKNSVILGFLLGMFETLKCWFENSVYYKLWRKIMDFFGRLYDNSLTAFLFSGKEREPVVSESLFSKLLDKMAGLIDFVIGKPCRFILKKAQNSFVVHALNFMLNNWQFISLRYYSVGLFAFGVISMAMDMAKNGFISNRWIAITAVAIVGMFINNSVSILANNEFLIKFFDITLFKEAKTIETKSYSSLGASVIAGAVFGALGIIPGLQLVMVVLTAVVVLAVKSGWLSFFAVVLLPFLPTMAVVGIMLFATGIFFIRYAAGSRKKINIDGFDLAVMGMGFMNIYGVINSETPVSSAKIAAVYLSFIVFFFVLRRYLREGENFLHTLDCFIVSATAVAGYGIIEQIFGLSETTWQDEEMFEEISGRACSTFENPNVLGEFLLITIPLTIAMLYNCKSSKSKALLVASSFMQVLCMVFTYSRGCWIGILFAMTIFIALCAKKLFVLMTVGIFALPFVVPQSVIDRLLSIGNTADTSTAYRVFIWEGTCRMLKETWLYGIGLGGEAFNSVYPRYALGAISAPHPHNLYLLILSETGFIGALLFIIAMLVYFRSTGKICRSFAEYRPLGIAFAAGMGGYLLQGMFDNVWYNYRIYAMFFIILAFVAALKDKTEVKRND